MEPDERTLLLSDEATQPESVTNDDISMQCKLNIYNAFLLVRYRNDLKLKENNQWENCDTIWLAVFAYFIAVVQWASLILLSVIVIDNSDADLDDFWTDMKWIPTELNTFLMFPFFVIAVITCRRDIHMLYQDLDAFSILKIKYGFHVAFFKLCTEVFLTFFGSMGYLIILAIFSDSHGNWSSMFDVILNLLAYQFIADVDENAYSAVEQVLKLNSRRTFGLFEVFCNIKNHDLTKKLHEEMIDIICWSFLFQGLFSRSYIFLLLPLLILPIWLIMKAKRIYDRYIKTDHSNHDSADNDV